MKQSIMLTRKTLITELRLGLYGLFFKQIPRAIHTDDQKIADAILIIILPLHSDKQHCVFRLVKTHTRTGFQYTCLQYYYSSTKVTQCFYVSHIAGISENDGYIYPWLDRLLSCCDPQVIRIGQETCQNLLR